MAGQTAGLKTATGTRLAAAAAVVLLALFVQAAMAQVPNLYAVILRRHNRYRSYHYTVTQKTPPLKWSATVATSATNYARRCVWAHDPNNDDYGENLFIQWGTGVTQSSALTAAIDAWYNEVANYDFSKPDWSPAAGHFTQVVWVDSAQLGCAVVTCPTVQYLSSASNAQLVVCRYAPPGNWLGEFADNVLPRGGVAAAAKATRAAAAAAPAKPAGGVTSVVLPAQPPRQQGGSSP